MYTALCNEIFSSRGAGATRVVAMWLGTLGSIFEIPHTFGGSQFECDRPDFHLKIGKKTFLLLALVFGLRHSACAAGVDSKGNSQSAANAGVATPLPAWNVGDKFVYWATVEKRGKNPNGSSKQSQRLAIQEQEIKVTGKSISGAFTLEISADKVPTQFHAQVNPSAIDLLLFLNGKNPSSGNLAGTEADAPEGFLQAQGIWPSDLRDREAVNGILGNLRKADVLSNAFGQDYSPSQVIGFWAADSREDISAYVITENTSMPVSGFSAFSALVNNNSAAGTSGQLKVGISARFKNNQPLSLP
jgi:hypothetical protein